MPPKDASPRRSSRLRSPVLSSEPPTGAGWIHEIKHDGFRTLFRIDRGDVRALTRGYDWSDKYQRVIDSCRKLRCRSGLIDGDADVLFTTANRFERLKTP
jgi:bifunctional non-homologous end joining protein LigD